MLTALQIGKDIKSNPQLLNHTDVSFSGSVTFPLEVLMRTVFELGGFFLCQC